MHCTFLLSQRTKRIYRDCTIIEFESGSVAIHDPYHRVPVKVPGKDVYYLPPPPFDAPNVPHTISDSAHPFAHKSSYFAPPMYGPPQPSLLGFNPSSESLNSELLRSYFEVGSDSSSDFSCSEEEDDLVYACVNYKTKSFVGVTRFLRDLEV